MRAGRLIAMLLALQREGRLTATQLAATLEVSPRTVLRDVEALSEAGIPVFTVQGAGGGIELVDRFRARLTSLTTDDAPGLLLAGAPGLAAALGLEPAAASARGKLLDVVAPELSDAAVGVDRWFLDDVAAGAPPASVTRTVALALRLGWQVGSEPGDGSDDGHREPLHPLGLVRSAGAWYLVHDTVDGPAVTPLDGVRRVRLVQRPARRPSGFDLATFWTHRDGRDD